MRHAAAKAVSDLGLSGAGLVRVRGWYAAQPDWQEAYSTKPQDIKKMPDADPRKTHSAASCGVGCVLTRRCSYSSVSEGVLSMCVCVWDASIQCLDLVQMSGHWHSYPAWWHGLWVCLATQGALVMQMRTP